MMHNYLQGIDLNYDRITQVIETGEDPGELDPEKILERILGEAGGLPPKLRDKIKELKEKKEGGKKGKKVEEL